SASFGGNGEGAKRPSVQVGDPFMEKLLIECCLELYAAGLVAGVQDLGAAGVVDTPPGTAADDGPVYPRPVARPASKDELQADDPAALPRPGAAAGADLGRGRDAGQGARLRAALLSLLA